MEFENNLRNYNQSLNNNHFIFELTKTCGYSEWITIIKKYTLKDLFRLVQTILGNNKFQLYVEDAYKNKCLLMESDYVLQNFLITNYSFFKPIYNLPNPVVYKIYLDDGHDHMH